MNLIRTPPTPRATIFRIHHNSSQAYLTHSAIAIFPKEHD
jgi:hypothetical protein